MKEGKPSAYSIVHGPFNKWYLDLSVLQKLSLYHLAKPNIQHARHVSSQKGWEYIIQLL